MANTKIPIELSSTPSIVDNGDATAITIDSSERVGILQGSPTSNLHIGASGNDAKRELRIDGTNGSGQTYGCIIEADGENGRFVFKVGQSGNTPAQQFMVHPDGGICFGSDTAAANALDDYEEGTFTVVVSSGITSVGYSVQDGYYTKIGNLIMFNIRVVTTSGNAQGSTFALDNLPLNAAVGQPGGFAVRAYSSSFSSSDNQIFINPNDNTLSFYKLDGTAFLGTDITDHDGFDLRISGVYRAV
jgi:hypothetical protein